MNKFTSVEPKVILPYDPIPGEVPRKVAIDRKRKEFRSLDFNRLLQEAGIEFKQKDQSVEWLKLEYFDDTTFDDNSNEDWIRREEDEEGIKHPLLGLGLRGDEYQYMEILEYKDDKFIGKWLKDDVKLELHRLYICFDAEDPRKYVKRLKNAFQQRIFADALVRYNYYIDNMSLFDLSELDNEQKKRIEQNAKTKKLEAMETTQLLLEVNMDFQRTMNKIIFDKYLDDEQQDENYPKLRLPAKERKKDVRYYGWMELEASKGVMEKWIKPLTFDELNKNFGFSTLYVSQEVVKALQDIRHECNQVLKESLFDFSKREGALHLDEFKHMQENATTSLMYQLKGTWVPTMIKIIKDRFAEIGKGWFNMKETSKITYDFGKLKRMLTVIRLMMQDTITTLMKSNFDRYQKTIKSNIPVNVDIKNTDWVLNKYDDGFLADNRVQVFSHDRKLPLFQIELLAKDDFFQYTTNPTLYVLISLQAMKKAVDEMAKIPDLEPRILSDLHKSQKLETFIKAPMMPIQEPFADENKWVWDTYYCIKASIEEALQPLEQYKTVFNKYIPVLKLRPDDVARDIELEDPPREFESIRDEIIKATQKEKQLNEEILDSIHVGMFEIHLNEAKGILIERYQGLQKNLIDLIARRARNTSIRIFQEFGDIKKTILEEPDTIEKLTLLKEYIGNLPQELEKMKIKMNQLFDVFKMLEEFNYRFPLDDFQRRWKIFGSPKEIKEMVEVRNGQLEKLKVKFSDDAKVQQEDFREQIENLERTIQEFHKHQDVSKNKDMAEVVEYVMKQISEFQEQASKFNMQEALFDKPQTDYSKLNSMSREFKPYYDLWSSTYKFKNGIKQWLNDDFMNVDADECERIVEEGVKNIQTAMRTIQVTGIQKIAEAVKAEIDEFRPKVPLLSALRKKGMTVRHWTQVSQLKGLDHVINPDEQGFCFQRILNDGFLDVIDKVVNIGETANKEYQIEMMLDNMLNAWENIKFQCVQYKNTFILKGFDEIQIVLDEHIINTSAMVFSPFKKFFEERISEWDKSLRKIQDILEEWAKFQQQWMYLQPIFDSQDIAKQLPAETKKFKTVDQTWRTTVTQAKAKEKVLDVCIEDGLWERLHEANKTLEMVQKELNNYLEKKREKFARFYFLSNDELLEILSQTKEPTAVQPHLKKVFENINSIEFDKDKKIHAMFSAEKEKVPFAKIVDPNKKNVEEWMNEVENMMRLSVRQALMVSIENYTQVKREEWVLKHPGQCVLNGSQVHWTKEVEAAIDAQNLKGYFKRLEDQLGSLVDLVRTKLSKQAMVTINALIVIDVHAKDVVQKMVESEVYDKFAFEWISQLRYYWENQLVDFDCWVKCVQTNFPYGYEYLGNTLRLVITPLTDKCYMTLMGALRLNLGGAPAGPAGTGKTESTKDLAEKLWQNNVWCSIVRTLWILLWLASSLRDQHLLVLGPVLMSSIVSILKCYQLLHKKAKGTPQVEFEGSFIKILPTFSVFITMNPGYAGRTELPDNLKALFRPVAMMVPDYAMIGEIMLYSFGFKLGRDLSKKMVTTFKLSSEQLSSQDHYDYGMRAVRSVINAAGLLKVQFPDMNEEQLLLRALRDVNVPKFLKDDLPLFENIISDLFPGLERPQYDYGKLIPELSLQCEKYVFKEQPYPVQPVQPFIDKVLQLYDTIQVRHGLMLVGPTGGGKTTNYQILSKSMTKLGEANGFYKVHTHILNPKSITMGQLYGQFNEQTHEWTDGVLAYMVREAVKDTSSDRHWIMFDGPVDALWIESMNTVLDDNKKLCLNSGQILTLTQYMTMMFEVEDLAVASPATVSRCGMVYMEPRAMGFLQILKIKKKDVLNNLTKWFQQYVDEALEFTYKHCKEVIPTMRNNLVQSQQRIIDSLISPYVETEIKKVSVDELDQLNQNIEYYFHYSLVWSIMVTGDFQSRQKCDKFHRQQMQKYRANFEYPKEGLIYDYQINLSPWSDAYQSFEIDQKLQFHEIVIPTTDSTRNMYLMKLILTNNFHVCCPGPTGTGKSQNSYQLLIMGMPEDFQYVPLTFSAQTSANQTQDTIDSWIDKRRKGVRGPPVGKRQVIFVDDLNMPKKEEYGAQPPIELIRQILDHQGWYNRQDLQFVKLEGLLILSAMGPPGGGRSNITGRAVRHFNVLAYTELDEDVIKSIFSKIIQFFYKKFSETVQMLQMQLINSVLSIYNSVRRDLLPTPSKSHYTFNLRDINKVFQGICSILPKNCQEPAQLVKLWYHENMRVFHDRLINEQDRVYFKQLLTQFFVDFGLKQEEVLDQERIIFCDFLGHTFRYKEIFNILLGRWKNYQINTTRMLEAERNR
ncbi:unnamed protein product (macronuclear) [Paramecium tetraurelia]|uniref:Uncharacterized protein n=1 Tax=Paramecium tetraurelia TaxID=5888 RepID=A0DJ78_PARTE|nr:uncharacterized protein GSPATT00017452001 [Paramecium tetraurelia]CAK83095.1 unnamed protein product [Paramecium tetraurelia]|eukprot:XP_001450492.1 hypothetical protein (macronuclear) [Paramecium tetraurelia strain d4-2]